ncbi:NitT/TauT family transport system substrate-binding protein [Rhodococcus rhodochrous J45]|uniref:NitT/TauT family transport system substrate-binding protein n=1 Tax=Rhodococcus rhodochrous J45 TaxID=935266 RepID=A0A562DL05_RHORH|nr:ABC transporter substrate-binding protein [Rhodococcus rhodochrous]TWH10295.1 NitT/TauT family transport system substrate-binding protein [Rhodococcus rhodochrous J45]
MALRKARDEHPTVLGLNGTSLSRGRRVAVTVALCLALGACGNGEEQTSADGMTALTVSTSVPSITTAGALAMDAQDIDAAHDLDVQFNMAGASSTLSVEAVLSGDADLALAGPASILAAMREGAPLTILGSTSNNLQVMLLRPDVLDRLDIGPDAPVEERVEALRGLTIGTNPTGSTYQILLRNELRSFGLNPDEDVTLVGVQDANALVTGIGQGQFDAVATSSGVVEQAIVNSGAVVWLSGPRGDVEITADLPVVAMVGRTDWVNENTETVDKFRDAMAESLESLRTDRDTLGPVLKNEYFSAMDQGVWDLAWSESAGGIPDSPTFPRSSFDFWVENDPEGAEAYDDVNYEDVTYGPAQD